MVDPYYCCVPDSDIPDVAFSVETTHVDLVLSHINWRSATNVTMYHSHKKGDQPLSASRYLMLGKIIDMER